MTVSPLKLWTPPANGGIVPPWLQTGLVADNGVVDVRVPTPDPRVIKILPMEPFRITGGGRHV